MIQDLWLSKSIKKYASFHVGSRRKLLAKMNSKVIKGNEWF